MTLIQKIIPVLTVVAFLIPGVFTDAIGQDETRLGDKSRCKSGDLQRRVQVRYYEQDRGVPCEVHYYKDSEEPGMGQVLWRAAHEAGFCEKKMAVFVKELSDLGWDCHSDEDVPPDLQTALPPE